MFHIPDGKPPVLRLLYNISRVISISRDENATITPRCAAICVHHFRAAILLMNHRNQIASWKTNPVECPSQMTMWDIFKLFAHLGMLSSSNALAAAAIEVESTSDLAIETPSMSAKFAPFPPNGLCKNVRLVIEAWRVVLRCL